MDGAVLEQTGAVPGPWWRHAVVYEVYPRSFADSDGDGVGDIAGLRSRLDHLAGLGVDALWIAPWFPSPLADGGYDVSDYTQIHPELGTLADAEALLADAHARGLRVIVDMVANHTSRDHVWFRAALEGGAGSPARDRYYFRDGRGAGGELPPNNWISAFGESAWSRVQEADGTPGQWYLHTFAPEQPDLNWSDEGVRRAFDEILRFWFDRGVDGIRVDAAPAMAKVAGLPDADYGLEPGFRSSEWHGVPHWDVDDVHEILRRWRAVGDTYADRVFVAEAVVNGPERLARYVRPDEMQTAFNFEFLKAAWGPGLRPVIDRTLEHLQAVGAAPTWVMSSHDEVRLVTRLGRRHTDSVHLAAHADEVSDPVLGLRRSRAATMLMLALPGSAYLYQGEELGLPFVDDLPDECLRDPMWERSGHTVRGRDGARVPLPWSGSRPPYGFGPEGSRPWLPQPATWAGLTVAAESADPDSMLNLVRSALAIRRRTSALSDDRLEWRPSAAAVLDFVRADELRCVVNFGPEPVPLDPDWQVLLTSSPGVLDQGLLDADVCAWLAHR